MVGFKKKYNHPVRTRPGRIKVRRDLAGLSFGYRYIDANEPQSMPAIPRRPTTTQKAPKPTKKQATTSSFIQNFNRSEIQQKINEDMKSIFDELEKEKALAEAAKARFHYGGSADSQEMEEEPGLALEG